MHHFVSSDQRSAEFYVSDLRRSGTTFPSQGAINQVRVLYSQGIRGRPGDTAPPSHSLAADSWAQFIVVLFGAGCCCVIAHGGMEAVVKLGIVLKKKISKDDLVPTFEHSWWQIEYEKAVRMWTVKQKLDRSLTEVSTEQFGWKSKYYLWDSGSAAARPPTVWHQLFSLTTTNGRTDIMYSRENQR